MIDRDVLRKMQGLPPLSSLPPPKLPKPGGSGGKKDHVMSEIIENLNCADKIENSLRGSFFDLYKNYDDGEYNCPIDEIEQKMIDTLKSWFIYHRKVVDLIQEKRDFEYKNKD